MGRQPEQAYAEINLQLREVQQLFNSLDPTPFPDRDLDSNAEEFIVGWALEHPSHLPIRLRISLSQPPAVPLHPDEITESVHHYFAYRADVVGRQLSQLLAIGRTSLIVGLTFLTLSVAGAHLIGRLGDSPWVQIFRESLVIGGWVAMWRPLQIFLYDWWPIQRTRALCLRLAQAEVQIQCPEHAPQDKAL